MDSLNIVEIPNKDTPIEEPVKQSSRGVAIAIFIIVGLFLIGYIVYMYEAYRNHFFPFPKFEFTPENMAENSVLALGTVTEEPVVDDDNRDDIESTIEDILANNYTWYKSDNINKSAAIKLQYPPLGQPTEN